MNFYEKSFALLISACAILTWRQYRFQELKPEEQRLLGTQPSPLAEAEASRFTRIFLTVYCLVMAADWLQGKIHLRIDSSFLTI